MAEKSKLGRNPFAAKKAQFKPVRSIPSQKPRTSGAVHADSEGITIERFKKAVRWMSLEAPLGICFLTYRVCVLVSGWAREQNLTSRGSKKISA